MPHGCPLRSEVHLHLPAEGYNPIRPCISADRNQVGLWTGVHERGGKKTASAQLMGSNPTKGRGKTTTAQPNKPDEMTGGWLMGLKPPEGEGGEN